MIASTNITTEKHDSAKASKDGEGQHSAPSALNFTTVSTRVVPKGINVGQGVYNHRPSENVAVLPSGGAILIQSKGATSIVVLQNNQQAKGEEDLHKENGISKSAKRFICSHCPFRVEFPDEEVYARHVDMAHPIHPPVIKKPNKLQLEAYPTSPSLAKHFPPRRLTPSFFPNECKFRCIVEYCQAAFRTGLELFLHVKRKQHFHKAAICGTCFTMFRYREAFRLHLKTTRHNRDLVISLEDSTMKAGFLPEKQPIFEEPTMPPVSEDVAPLQFLHDDMKGPEQADTKKEKKKGTKTAKTEQPVEKTKSQKICKFGVKKSAKAAAVTLTGNSALFETQSAKKPKRKKTRSKPKPSEKQPNVRSVSKLKRLNKKKAGKRLKSAPSTSDIVPDPLPINEVEICANVPEIAQSEEVVVETTFAMEN